MRNYSKELEKRVAFIRSMLEQTHASGIVFGNSGGKDSALVGILCKKACDNTVGVLLPCQSKRNFGMDLEDGKEVADQFQIETRMVDLTDLKALAIQTVENATSLTEQAIANIAPRLRMMTLYAIAASENRLVAGTGNRSEGYMGYFTKWGDGAHDFNPISDLTVQEIYEFLAYLDAPKAVRTKAPSAGLFEGQTDEQEMGITYAAIDAFLLEGKADPETLEKIQKMHARSEHKRHLPSTYADYEKMKS